MGIQTKLLQDGTKILLSRYGNSSVMQILDSTGNIIKTRCKSISRMAIPVSTDAPVRTSIGFIPQQLRSHVNDVTRTQIGFRLSGEKPLVFPTAVEKNKYVTITKTDFNENFDIVNTCNRQRQYDPKGVYTRTITPASPSYMQLSDLYQQQRQVIIDSLKKSKIELNDYQLKLQELDAQLKGIEDSIGKSKELVRLSKKALENSRDKDTLEGLLSYFGDYRRGIESKPKISAVEDFGLSWCKSQEAEYKSELNKILELEKKIQEHQANILDMTQFIAPVKQQRESFTEALELMKSYRCTDAETNMRELLCNIQKKITSLFYNA